MSRTNSNSRSLSLPRLLSRHQIATSRQVLSQLSVRGFGAAFVGPFVTALTHGIPIAPGGFQRAPHGARRRNDFAIMVAGEPRD